MQVDEEGQAALLLPRLEKEGRLTLTLEKWPDPGLSFDAIISPTPPPAEEGVRATMPHNSDTLTLEAVDTKGAKPRPMVVYQTTPGAVPAGTDKIFAHGAHLHPVYSPKGRLLTANHPPDHPHQRGIWMSWTKVEAGVGGHPDFWNMGKDKSGKLTGDIQFAKVTRMWSGPVHAGFTSEHLWMDYTRELEALLLTEKWEVTACRLAGRGDKPGAAPRYSALDLVSTQEAREPVKLPKYHYGGLGVRGSAQWDAVDAVTMLTSEGLDRKAGDGQKARWVWMGGKVDGAAAGMAVLIHPDNFRFPQPLRLNPKNPQLCVAPSAEGDWSIEPEKPLVLKYRIILADETPEAAELERLWVDYARPP